METIPAVITECSLVAPGRGDMCMSDAAATAIANKLKVAPKKAELLKATGCYTEKCVLQSAADIIGNAVADREIKLAFKHDGPVDTKLLSNYNIDNILKQWQLAHPRFFAYNFNMSNFADYSFIDGSVIARPDSLATVDWTPGNPQTATFDCAGCVINTDVYQGAGKHWMALFIDRRSTPATAEFFNSSGRCPSDEWAGWLVKTRNQLGAGAEIVKCCGVKHQKSRSECGVYSLFYIWSRLNGKPARDFLRTPISDYAMFEFRQHLFNSNITGKFDVEQYMRENKTRWEN